jgi:predicted Zn finger-like uncharacterized protein
MKLACSSCQARYTLADHKVRGKVVRIRCKRCGAIIVADGGALAEAGRSPHVDEPPARSAFVARDAREEGAGGVAAEGADVTGSPARPGERHEESVLFSLAALGRTTAPAHPPVTAAAPSTGATSSASAESSGLIDLRVLAQSMGRGANPGEESHAPASAAASDLAAQLASKGVFAAPFLTPESTPPAHDLGAHPRGRGLPIIAGALGVVLVVSVSLGLARESQRPASPRPESPIGVAVATSASPSSSPQSAGLPRDEAKLTEAPASPAPRSKSPPVASVAARPAPPPAVVLPSAVPAAPRCCPGETDTTCEMRRAVGAACGARAPAPAPAAASAPTAPPFDSAGAARALAAVDLRACALAGTNAAHARVTFQPTGAVSDVVVDTPEIAGTPAERCLVAAVGRVKIAAFSGSAVTVGKRFGSAMAP